ncbi:hypothetical protein ACF0H5_018231 [Mactra antiquata]
MGSGATKPRRKPELLQCSICFNVFKVPRMLPCQHTFCEGCLHTYITKSIVFVGETVDFPCPLCREPTPIPKPDKPRDKWAKLFPKNRLMLSLFEGEAERSESCRLHPGKQIEFYCENHVEIACSTCLITRHKGCQLEQLHSFIKSGKFKRTCNKDNDMLQQYKKMFEDLIVEADKNVDSLETEKSILVEEITTMRANVEAKLRELEKKLLTEIDDKFQSECATLSEQSGRCRKILTDISNTIEQISAAQTDINMVQKAGIIVTVEEKLQSFGTNIRQEHEYFKHVNMSVTVDPLIVDLKVKLETFGNINIERTEVDHPVPGFVPKMSSKKETEQTPVRHKSKHVVKVSEHSISGNDENFYCNVTSTVVLTDGRIVLADDSNSKLKLLNGRYQVINELKLGSNPLNMASISEDEIAVTLPGERQVEFVRVGVDSFTQTKNFKTRLDCWGIDIIGNMVVITTGRDGHAIILYEKDGKEVNSFVLTGHADENVRCPVAVVADNRQSCLYVTCTGGAWSKGCVACINLDGKLMSVYSDPGIDTPRSAALDRHGKLYICGMESSSIYQINVEKGTMFRIFPSKTEHVVGPLHMNFVRNYHIRFLVTEVASDRMKIYELPTAK